MEEKKSIINPELYNKVRKNNFKIQKKIKTYKKPLLGRILDKFGGFCEFFSDKIAKRPLFFVLFCLQLIILTRYFFVSCQGNEIQMYRWMFSSFFLGFFGYFTFFRKKSKNQK